MRAVALHRHRTWHVNQPIAVGLTYKTRSGAQVYKVVAVLGGDSTYAVCTVERQTGDYAGNHDTHTIRYAA